MAQIDLDKVGNALSFVRDTAGGQEALRELRASLDSFGTKLQPPLNHSEHVFMLRTLMADLSIDHPAGIPNAGPGVGGHPGAVQQLGTPQIVKNLHGFAVLAEK
jgi:hypothetical protein